MLTNIKALKSNGTIVLHYNGDSLNVQKENRPVDFEKISRLIDEGNVDEIVKSFIDIKAAIENYTDKNFTVEKGQLKLKGHTETMPNCIVQKLMELKTANENYMPLVNFYKHSLRNPSISSIEQLYRFVEANKIPITDHGFLLLEKGVKKNSAGLLIDDYTGTIDNSIGMVVGLPREKVDPNPKQTCSYGLHVAAPQYVRKWYSNNVLVECLVDPADVVAVPTDYNETKMRVCRYQVIGFAKSTPREELVIKFDDLFEIQEKEKIPSESSEIVANVWTISFVDMKCKDIVELVKKEFDKEIGGKDPRKARVVAQAKKLFEEAGYTVIE